MQDFEHSLKLGLVCPVYLFYGDDSLLLEQALEKLTKFVNPTEDAWNNNFFDADESGLDEVLISAQLLSFSAQKKLVIVRNAPWFSTRGKAAAESNKEYDDENKPLLAYLQDPNPQTVLVFVLSSAPAKNSSLYKAVLSAGRVVECSALNAGAREIWLKNYLRSSGKQVDPAVVAYICAMCADNLSSLQMEADKLLLYCHDKPMISMEDAENIISRSSLAGVFEMTDAVAARKSGQAVQVMRRLLQQGESPYMLLSMLATQYRNVLAVKNMTDRGFSQQQIASKMHINPYVVKKSLPVARKYDYPSLVKALEMLLAADYDSKSGKRDIEYMLELAVLRICTL